MQKNDLVNIDRPRLQRLADRKVEREEKAKGGVK